MSNNSLINLFHRPLVAYVTLPVSNTLVISYNESIGDKDIHLSSEENSASAQISGSTCAFCKKDFDGEPLGMLSVYPICEGCKKDLDQKIFPLWVKIFFGGIIALVIVSIAVNWRFFAAYNNFKNATKTFAIERNIDKAASLMKKAASEVPESSDVAEMGSYFAGMMWLTKDSSAKALAEFEHCKELPADYHINDMVLQAEMGVGFDTKDYDLFLKSAKAFLQLDTTQAGSWAGVSSAYACLYAQKNAESLKILAMKYLNRSKLIDDTSATAKEYAGRIQYRLDTKDIISKEVYDKKFPSGYTHK